MTMSAAAPAVDSPHLDPPPPVRAELDLVPGTIITFTGRRVRPAALVPSDIDVADIAHHLSHINRFTGATRVAYSVAQHAVLASLYVASRDPWDQLWALHHDDSEAYLNDLNRAIKHHSALFGYRELERHAMRAVCVRFGLTLAQPACVKAVDERLLLWEQRDLMHPNALGPRTCAEPNRIYAWLARQAEDQFLERHAQLVAACRRAR